MTIPTLSTQNQRRAELLHFLLNESGQVADIPADEAEQRRWLRSLVNVRPLKPVPDDTVFGDVRTGQDAFTDGFKIDDAAANELMVGVRINF